MSYDGKSEIQINNELIIKRNTLMRKLRSKLYTPYEAWIGLQKLRVTENKAMSMINRQLVEDGRREYSLIELEANQFARSK